MVKKPDYVPEDFVLVSAEDGCTYWMKEAFVGDEDYFFPCYRYENHDTDESWHTGNEMRIVENDED